MDWNSIIGHEREIAVLRKVLRQQAVAHALLFDGPVGIGKARIAAVLAKTLLCESDQDEPCGHCLSCRAFAAENHPDFIQVIPAGSSIKIDQIRQLQQEAALSPRFGQRRVFLIDEAEKMTQQAQNSLLKILEEPPGSITFILVAQDLSLLLETIFSRCQRFHFSVISKSLLEAALCQEGWSRSEAQLAARLSQGSVRRARELLSQEGRELRRVAADWLKQLFTLPQSKLLAHGEALAEALTPLTRSDFFYFCKLLLRDGILRELCDSGAYAKLAVSTEDNALPLLDRQQSVFVWERMVFSLQEAETALQKNGNPRIVFESLALSLHRLWRSGNSSI
ncbi:MAG: DNA polymerase III subunit delta' [Sporomusaceae bacterium]|nr:DNA polymerase III subunit delta' [Sporomusaceae bacterium]